MTEAAAVLPKTVEPSDVGKQNMITARVDLIRMFPFISFLVMSTDYRFTLDIPTMAATTHGGIKVYINEEFMNQMTRAERTFVLAHEILHIFLEHLGRCRDHNYDPALWNIATDFCINSYLIEMKKNINTPMKNSIEMPKFGLYEERFKEMSADKIYHILLKENNNDSGKAKEKYGMPGQGDEGNGSSGMKPFDELQKEPMSESQKIENRQKVAASLSQSNTEALKNMGSGFANLIRAFEDMIESKIPWQQVLRDFVVKSSKNRYTYARPSRKSYHSGIIFPTMTGENINLLFGVDTSGSMSDTDLSEALSELQGICEEFDNWKLTLMSCDSQANVIGEYDSEEGDDFAFIDKSLIGGGGTDMSPFVEYANEMDDAPSVVVIITDGYIPESTLDDAVEDVPVIVVVTSSGNKNLSLENCKVTQMSDPDDE